MNITDIITTIKQRTGSRQRAPQLGIILGSGSGNIAEQIQGPITLPYEELPGFSTARVKGHAGQLILGTLQGLSVACLQGRPHFYEGYSNEALKIPIHTLKALGCHTLLLTNAAGSLNPDIKPGDLALITDHINMQCNNPLLGPNNDTIGPRFPDMTNAYDAALRKQMKVTAKRLNIPLTDGIYVGVLGPSYETPAEIRAFRLLGADLVGMSTVPEVIIAKHCGLRVIAVSIVTNMASGMTQHTLSHDEVLKIANNACGHLSQLIQSFVKELEK